MPFVPAPLVAQVELVFLWDTQRVQNVLHYELPEALTQPIANIIGAYCVSWWDTQMKTASPSSLQFIEVAVKDLTTEWAPAYVYATGLPITGTNVSAALPNNCSVTITKRTAFRGRSFRGRIYHIGLMEGGVTGNKVDPGTLAPLITKYSQLLSIPINAGNAYMCVLSKRANKMWRAEAEVTRVSSLTSDGIVDSQRRRLPGRGK